MLGRHNSGTVLIGLSNVLVTKRSSWPWHGVMRNKYNDVMPPTQDSSNLGLEQRVMNRSYWRFWFWGVDDGRFALRQSIAEFRKATCCVELSTAGWSICPMVPDLVTTQRDEMDGSRTVGPFRLQRPAIAASRCTGDAVLSHRL